MPSEWERVCEEHPHEAMSTYPELHGHAIDFHDGAEDFHVVWRRHRRLSDPPREVLGWG